MAMIKLEDESWKQLALLTDPHLVLYEKLHQEQKEHKVEGEEKEGIEMTRL